MNTNRSWKTITLGIITALVACSCAAQSSDAQSFSSRGEGRGDSRAAVSGWECNTVGGGTQLSPEGRYYATSFGCWLDDSGKHRGDSSDNCIPYCIDSVCDGKEGRACEESIKWYTAGERRYGCGTRLRVTNPSNKKSVVVMVIDKGPNCKIEDTVEHWVADLSYPTTSYLFGEEKSATEKGLVIVENVASSTALGPTTSPTPTPAPGSQDSACGGVSFEGKCKGDQVQWCESGKIQSLDCASDNKVCAFNDAQQYYDCLTSGDQGASGSGGGKGDAPGTGGASSVGGSASGGGSGGSGGSSGSQSPSGCGNVTTQGSCSGSTLEYCESGTVTTVNCANQGMGCGFNTAQGYYDCLSQGASGSAGGSETSCGSVDSVGTCSGDLLEYCDSGKLVTVDCSSSSLTCSWNSQSSYYDCL